VHDSSVEKARWLRDLLRFLPLRSQFVLSGNTRDLQIYEVSPGEFTAAPLSKVLPDVLKAAGYGRIAWFDLLNGFRDVEPADGSHLTQLGLVPTAGTAAGGIDLLSTTLERHVMAEGQPSALIVDFASRLVARNDALSPAEHQLFSRALILSHAARARPAGDKRLPFFNTVVWIVDKEGDLPDWFLIGNPKIRHVPIGRPDHLARRSIIRSLVRSLPGAQNADQSELEKCTQGFVDETEGLLLLDVSAVAQLARSEGVQFDRIGDAVRRFKVGVTEDPWRKISRDKINSGEEFVRRRVKGQSHAVTHMLDIVKRAVTGIGQSPRGGRPRGVVFLAGPTGVGKTELAKTITSLLFGDESAYIRFDMSEFSAEHSDQRLIGAPPGYIGYDVGGELTNAIREKPFSVVLFDEIEKAHPRILDKFLQVLDDGVLTSGRGDRVYFSEAFIVFTSNLGIYVPGPSGERIANVTPEENFDSVRRKVRSEIEKHFKQVLNRPEILNRIGENVIVFDFIRPEVANDIFDQMVDNLLRDVKSLGYGVTLTGAAREVLRGLCLSDLSNGGRGIRNQVESHLINPLSRSLFDRGAQAGHRYRIDQIRAGPSTTIDLVSEQSP